MHAIITVDTSGFNQVFRRYAEEWTAKPNRTPRQALVRQARNFSLNLYRGLKAIAPDKGSIRNARLESLRSGGGIKISDKTRARIYKKYNIQESGGVYQIEKYKRGARKSILKRGRRLNIQALMVESELNMRERARMFSAASVLFPLSDKGDSKSKKGNSILGLRTSTAQGNESGIVFSWGVDVSPTSAQAASGLTTSQQQGIVMSAMKATIADMESYLMKKTGETFYAA